MSETYKSWRGTLHDVNQDIMAEAAMLNGHKTADQVQAEWIEKSINALSKDAKTLSDNQIELNNKLATLKTAINQLHGVSKQELQNVIDRLDDLASQIKGVTDPITIKTKPLDSWDLSVDGIGRRTVTLLPYSPNYLVRYMKNGLTFHEIVSSKTNHDIKWEDVGGKLAYTELVHGLGMMEIWSGTP